MPFEPIVPEGQHLGASHEHEGAVTGHLFSDEDNKLQGHAAWRWVDEEEPSPTYVYVQESPRELTPEEREILEKAVALITLLVVIGAQKAAPHVKRWWYGTARPTLQRAWNRVKRRPPAPEPIEPEPIELIEVLVPDAEGTAAPGTALMPASPKFTMSSDEWAGRYRAMIAAGEFRDVQAHILAHAQIQDEAPQVEAAGATELTPQQFAAQLTAQFAARPELLTQETVAELRRLLDNRSK